MILAEQDDEWQDGRRYFRPETVALIDTAPELEEVGPGLLIASWRRHEDDELHNVLGLDRRTRRLMRGSRVSNLS
jgi:hypothetical protein